MKITMENVMAQYNENMKDLTKDGVAIDFTDINNVYALVGKFKTPQAYENRILAFIDGHEDLEPMYTKIISECKKDKTNRINELAKALLTLCKNGYPDAFKNPEDKDKIESSPTKTDTETTEDLTPTSQTDIKVKDLFQKSVYIKASGFRGAVNHQFGSLDDVYMTTEVSLSNSKLSTMMNRLLELLAFLNGQGFDTVVTGYENNDETNTFIFFLDRAVQIFNANAKTSLKFIAIRGKECIINLNQNIDYCVTGKFNASPVVIQKHGDRIRKMTEILNDARQARTFKVYNGEIIMDGARIPVLEYIRELNYLQCGLSEQGFKRSIRFCVPIVSGNHAFKIDKKTYKDANRTTLQIIKDLDIATCVYIGNHADGYKDIIKRNTGVKSYKGYDWNVILNGVPVKPEVVYLDQDIVSDGLPLGE